MVSTNSKLPRIFNKTVTTDKRDYKFSRNFFAEKNFPNQNHILQKAWAHFLKRHIGVI